MCVLKPQVSGQAMQGTAQLRAQGLRLAQEEPAYQAGDRPGEAEGDAVASGDAEHQEPIRKDLRHGVPCSTTLPLGSVPQVDSQHPAGGEGGTAAPEESLLPLLLGHVPCAVEIAKEQVSGLRRPSDVTGGIVYDQLQSGAVG